MRVIMNERVSYTSRIKLLLTNRKVNYHVIHYRCNFNNIVVAWISHFLYNGRCYSHSFGNCYYNDSLKSNKRSTRTLTICYK